DVRWRWRVRRKAPERPGDGLRVESVANLDRVQLVARSRLVRRVGRARPATMSSICRALAIAVGCEP
ncbi:MAG: hypothetical protein JWM18_2781, partial [Chloroflexi bacterium]|nr:hypothetical protein [Chloroflexota bacterium]